jgi:hypothetical protein
MEAVVEDVCQYARNPMQTQPTPRQGIPQYQQPQPSYSNPIEPLSPEELIRKDKLIGSGWEKMIITNGQMNTCYNIIPQKGDIDNYLDIYVGSSTDVVVKIMDCVTGICIRYLYVSSNTSYKARNIPEGRYYLKIAYGKEWYSKIENGQCIGRFLRNPLYEKGDEILDYRKIYDHISDGYKIPSFSVKLDVISTNRENEFPTTDITEDEFNK